MRCAVLHELGNEDHRSWYRAQRVDDELVPGEIAAHAVRPAQQVSGTTDRPRGEQRSNRGATDDLALQQERRNHMQSPANRAADLCQNGNRARASATERKIGADPQLDQWL